MGGNIISIADLLRLADPNGEMLMDKIKKEDQSTLRWNGGVLSIEVEYESKHQWRPLGDGEMSYVLSAELLAQSEFKNMYGTIEEDGTRLVHDIHGLLVIAHVHGHVYEFSLQYLCQVLTTSIGMMAVASLVVDWVMTNCLSHKEKYATVMTQPSLLFDDEVLQNAKDDYKSLGEKPVHHIHSDLLRKMVGQLANDENSTAEPDWD